MSHRDSNRALGRSPHFDNLEGRALLSGVPSVAAADAFVVNLYQTVLSRSATPGEISYWTNRIERGVSESTVGKEFALSAEHQNGSVAIQPTDTSGTGGSVGGSGGKGGVTNSNIDSNFYTNYIGGTLGLKAFVDGLYSDVLHQAPDDTGEAYYTNLLATGGATPSKVVKDFLHIASTVGLDGQAAPTPPSGNIYTSFLGGQTGVQAFVDGLYEDVLFRTPDPTGVAYWVNQIEQGGLQPGLVTISFLRSAEFGASGSTVTTG